MKQAKLFAAALLLSSLALPAVADDAPAKDKDKPDAAKIESFKPESKTSEGSVNVGGRHIDYQAVAGTLVVHAKGWDDVPQNADKDAKEGPAEASMFYVAYFKKGAKASERPVTFIFNGGPGSSSVWLHMGAFGPRRVVTADDSHSDAAPYPLINNDYSLLDASDLVFIDAPGTGFSR
ncbi:MAG: peptidase, partial [Nevskia sp.]|nr:peptidase [Nevskia sp.]